MRVKVQDKKRILKKKHIREENSLQSRIAREDHQWSGHGSCWLYA